MNIKAGIVIEDWKLPAFSKALRQAGFHYEQHDGPGKGIYTLTVKVAPNEISKLNTTVKEAQATATKEKK